MGDQHSVRPVLNGRCAVVVLWPAPPPPPLLTSSLSTGPIPDELLPFFVTVANGAVDLPTVQVCVFVGVGPVIM